MLLISKSVVKGYDVVVVINESFLWALARSVLLNGLQLFVVCLEFEVEDLDRVLAQRLPLDLLEAGQVHRNRVDVRHNLFNTAVYIDLLRERLCFCSQHVLRLLFGLCVVEEIPAEGRSHRVQLLALVIQVHLLVEELLRVILLQLLFVLDALLDIDINDVADFFLLLFSFCTLEAFEQDGVLDVLQNVIINIFEHFYSVQPNILVLLVEVAFPDPVAPILLSFRLVDCSLFLGFAE